MINADKLKIIHNALKLLAPGKEYDLSDYDIFYYDEEYGYIQIFCLDESIYVESIIGIPTEMSILFKLRKISDEDSIKIYDVIEKDAAALDIIRPPSPDAVLYKATLKHGLFDETK